MSFCDQSLEDYIVIAFALIITPAEAPILLPQVPYTSSIAIRSNAAYLLREINRIKVKCIVVV
jgi:hypothetical protein